MQHSPFNCVATTWTLNALKMTDHPLLLWLRLAAARLSARQPGWRGEAVGPDGAHPMLVASSFIQALIIKLEACWTVPFDWDDRSRMRLSSFTSSVYAMRTVVETLGIKFPFPVPDEDDLVKPAGNEMMSLDLMISENARWAAAVAYGSPRLLKAEGASERSTVGVAPADCVEFARLARRLMGEFAAVGVGYAVTADGIPFITATHRETSVDIVRLFKKVAETDSFRGKVTKGTTKLELFAHFLCSQILRHTGPSKQHGPWVGVKNFLPTSHHLPTALFGLPITQRGSTTPSPSRFSHATGPTASADAHITGFSAQARASADFSFADFNSASTSNFGWDCLYVNNGLLKCQGPEGDRLVSYWKEASVTMTRNHFLTQPAQLSASQDAKLNDALTFLTNHGKMVRECGFHILERGPNDPGSRVTAGLKAALSEVKLTSE